MAQSGSSTTPISKRPRPRKLLRLAFIVGAVAILGVGGLLYANAQKAERAKRNVVRTEALTRGSIVQKISSTGVVAAETGADVKVGSQISGRIRRLYADVGSVVKANQVIAELDAPDLQANREAARRALNQNQVKYQQQLSGVGMLHTQLASAFEQASDSLIAARARAHQARASLASAQSRLRSARAALVGSRARQKSAEAQLRSARASSELQTTQTSTDLTKAQAALSTAQSTLLQTQRTADLSIGSADAALKQARSNASLAELTLKRQEALLAKGFVAAADVDNARTQRDVAAQQAVSAENTANSTRAQVQAQLQSSRDAVEQAKAALTAAQAGPYQNSVRIEAVRAAESSLDDSRASVVQAEMTLESAQADVTSAHAAVTSADSDINSASAAQRTALGNLTQDRLKQQDVKVAYEAMRQSGAQVAYQEAQYDKSYIRSPINGTVITLTQQQGETVAAGLSAPTLIEVCDLSRMEVVAYVDETDIGKVRLGQSSEITVDAFAKRKFTGKIYKISSAATLQQNVVTYAVSVRLDTYPIGLLKPQMTADVQIILDRGDNLLLAPNEAVKQGKGVTQVVVMNGSTPEVRSISIGRTDGSFTEVTAGLKDGEKVVMSGFDQLGIKGFSSAAEVPGFLKRGPLGTGGGEGKGSKGGGGRSGGGGGPH